MVSSSRFSAFFFSCARISGSPAGSHTTATDREFFAADAASRARDVDVFDRLLPVQPGRAIVASKGYRFRPACRGDDPVLADRLQWRRIPAQARSPPWIFGSGFHPPRQHLGEPSGVLLDHEDAPDLSSPRSFAVPPEAYSSTPSRERRGGAELRHAGLSDTPHRPDGFSPWAWILP